MAFRIRHIGVTRQNQPEALVLPTIGSAEAARPNSTCGTGDTIVVALK